MNSSVELLHLDSVLIWKSNKSITSEPYSYLKLINFPPANNNWVFIQGML